MRYHDASHVDVGSFYARSPAAGKLYRILGHLGVGGAVFCAWRHDLCALSGLLLALILLWLLAWWQVVGTLWRASLVAGIVACAIGLTAERCCKNAGALCCAKPVVAP